MRWLRRLLGIVLLLLAVAAAALWIYARRALPQTEGLVSVAGVREEVRIERDDEGIPTVHARSIEDAAFGLGYVHAQDRLWQLEVHRRIGAGRLAEAFGEPALATDRFLRALGVRRAAAAQWASASIESKAVVTAYTAGINAALGAMKARPPEFIVLSLQPEPWTPQDTVAWAIMMAWDLGGNWGNELTRLRLSLKLPVARIDELLPPYPGDRPLVQTDYAALFRGLGLDGRLGTQALADAPESGVEGVGSNNWVVAGTRSASGKPLLANDPHLRLAAPSLWYFARLDVPGLKVAGASIPALPGIVLGQNEKIAWGFTNTGPDVQDLYLERIKPGDAAQYQTPDGWAAFEHFDETIKVKGRPDVVMRTRATRHGPVIDVADGVTGPKDKPTYAIAMRWTALDADVDVTDAMLGIARADSVAEFIAASARYVAPMQNMVVADRDGHIGMVAAGRVPLRKPENDLKGQVPSPGWDARYDWAGFLDPALTPREVDPPRGYIATANQRIHAADYPHYLGSEWTPPYRQQRIEQLIEATPRHDEASFRAMQADQVSLATRRLLPFLRQARSNHPLAAAAQRQLAGFDGAMRADQAAPLIFWAWVRQLTHGVFADELDDAAYDNLIAGRGLRDALEGVLERGDAWWCDDKATPAAETCQQQIDAAFQRALEELAARQGNDVAAWRWGQAHIARAEHRPFSNVGALAGWFELRTAVGGDTYTLDVSRVNLRPDRRTGELYLAEHGPSMRGIYDLGDASKSRVMLSSGQSGFFFSPLYRDLLTRWAAVDSLPLWNEGSARTTLTLKPGP